MADHDYPSDEYEDIAATGVPSAAPTTPREVLEHQTMSIGAKRALLASWASDRRAVENWPALRRLENGRELHIDDILDALKALDGYDKRKPQANLLPFRDRRNLTNPRRAEQSAGLADQHYPIEESSRLQYAPPLDSSCLLRALPKSTVAGKDKVGETGRKRCS